MTLDERVIRVLGEMTDDLRPAPAPYDRVRARWRRRRRRRATAASVGLVALVAAGALTAIRVPGDGAPELAEETNSNWSHVKVWSQRLYESPTRGGLAGDTGYLATLTSTLANKQPAGEYREVKVLFLDDVGPYRVALVAFARANPDPNFWAYGATWYLSARGAGAAELAATQDQVGDGLAPYEERELTGGNVSDPVIQVALAADGCEFESAPWPAVTDWRPEATGSYLVRAPQEVKREWWRVACDGVVRKEGPAPGQLGANLTEAQFASALATTRGTKDAELARDALTMSSAPWGYEVTGLPEVIWQGRISGTGAAGQESYDGRATMVSAPAVGGGWRGMVFIRYDAIDPVTNSAGTSSGFETLTDPSDPSSVVVVSLHDNATLVVTPATAAEVSVVRDGALLAKVPAKDGSAVLGLHVKPGDVVRARDSAGAEVGAVTVDDTPLPRKAIDRWHEE